MSGDKNEDFLIAHLLEETYQSLPSHDESSPLTNLNAHFDHHHSLSKYDLDPTLDNFLNRQASKTHRLEYKASIGCYRIELAHQKIDLPGNWGAFARLGREVTFVNLNNDELSELLATLLGREVQCVLIGSFGNARISFFENEDDISIKWLEKYFAGLEKKEAA
ncbi:MAG: hypothetical protein COW01_05585 [Bdellovibrionales bacterium CG12_big_fil_rev_8_21_14_0_65_38_15]|nr:MAG: hypothetical protein COW79_03480 [Bdellovibrionales bacterium CG22_combo_CG10-13_8_21_14_all_38_13]PIQ55903.1 MAG: hypothetical protein COW01_05585 [Bdellovibrionales bacterium CG12_big_fil_rev_8_21_14_0_65_38_15]PIR29646.1 MAG: hypothetical protein COV38_09435 [Bdellovibrionales bacterium CG11_big_fil_rev_8_21_14_0_20_38_13]